MGELLTVAEAARECRRNPETVRRWIWEGKLPAQKLGRQLFILETDLRAFTSGPGEPDKGARLRWLSELEEFHGRLDRKGVAPMDTLADLHELREARS